MSTAVEVPQTALAVSSTMRDAFTGLVPATKVLVPYPEFGPRKAIYCVNVGGVRPFEGGAGRFVEGTGWSGEVSALTYPLLIRYAEKIGASLQIITERAFRSPWPVTTEKFQALHLAKRDRNEWTMVVDSDTLIHPDCFDFSEHVDKDTVMHNGKDVNTIRWTMDEYFRRDGRFIGSCTWFTVASDWCLDTWQPLDMSYEDVLKRIHITAGEQSCGLNPPEHLIDDYTTSRNIARYGLKFKTFTEICQGVGMPGNPYLFHLYTHTDVTKFARMCSTMIAWGCLSPDEAKALGQKWKIHWDACPGMDGRGAHNPQQQCPHCGNSGVANARRVK